MAQPPNSRANGTPRNIIDPPWTLDYWRLSLRARKLR